MRLAIENEHLEVIIIKERNKELKLFFYIS
jgi:hypothetical protein